MKMEALMIFSAEFTNIHTCEVCKPSKKPRLMGYKEFSTHMANHHGGLEEILFEHKDEKVRQLVSKLRKR